MEPTPKVTQLPPDPAGGRLVDCAYSRAGDRMATASSSGAVQVWAATTTATAAAAAACTAGSGGGGLLHADQIEGGPTRLAWAPDEAGAVLAVGLGRGGVAVLRAGPGGAWGRGGGGDLPCGRGAVRDLAFAPAQQGLVLAAACDDGRVYVYEGATVPDTSSGADTGSGGGGGALAWTLLSKIEACERGPCSCVCWRPFTAGVPPLLLAGSARGAKAWCYQQGSWRECGALDSPDGASPAAAVHWAPSLGRPFDLAAASFGADVAVYKLTGSPASLAAGRVALLTHPGRVWRVEFNAHGNALGASVEGASGAAPEVWLSMPSLGGAWGPVSRIAGGGQAA